MKYQCPKCGGDLIIMLGKVYFPRTSQEESDRRNFHNAKCQECGYTTDKLEDLQVKIE